MFTLTEAVAAALVTYALMVAAFFLSRRRVLHMAAMALVILFDTAMPFYLLLTRDWVKRLLDDGDILSFGVWTHFGLVITLYALYVVQLQTAARLVRGQDARGAHHQQAKGILLVRALVIITGAWLAEPTRSL